MPEGLSQQKNDEASRLGHERRQMGDLLAETLAKQVAAQAAADKFGMVAKRTHRAEAKAAQETADERTRGTGYARDALAYADNQATSAFKSNEAGYVEQAKLEMDAELPPTDTSDVAAENVDSEPTPRSQVSMRSGETEVVVTSVAGGPVFAAMGNGETTGRIIHYDAAGNVMEEPQAAPGISTYGGDVEVRHTS